MPKGFSMELWDRVRETWETTPTISFARVAAQYGLTKASVLQRKCRDGWVKRLDGEPHPRLGGKDLSQLANNEADALPGALIVSAQLDETVLEDATEFVIVTDAVPVELVDPPEPPSEPPPPEDPPASAAEPADEFPPINPRDYPPVERETLRAPEPPPDDYGSPEERQIALRAKLIDRHRSEWLVIRRKLYEATKGRSRAADAKTVLVLAQAMTALQNGERKAWGLETNDGDGEVKVTIVREDA